MRNLVLFPTLYAPNPDLSQSIGLGYFYIGNIDTDPTILANRKTVYLTQENGSVVTIPAASQPIELSAGGVPTYLGSPVQVATDGDYSMTVLDVDDVAQYYFPNSNNFVDVTQWEDPGVTPTYVSGTSFTVAGDQTAAFEVGRKVRATINSGYRYGWIITSAYTSLTTVTVAWESGTIDATLSAVDLGIITRTNNGLPGPRNNYAATVPPVVTDDSASGYDEGSVWVDGTANQAFMCSDPAVGAAVWQTLNVINRNELLNPGFNVAQSLTTFDATTNPANSDGALLFDCWRLLSDGNDIVDVSRTAQGSANVDNAASFGLLLDIETANKKFLVYQCKDNEWTKGLFQNATGKLSAAISLICSNVASFGNVRLYILGWTGTANSVTRDFVTAWGAGSTQPTWAANIVELGNLSITPTTALVRSQLQNIAISTAGINNIIFVVLNNDDVTTITHTMTLSAPKMEQGPVNTIYKERPPQQELQDCLRYRWRQNMANTADLIANGKAFSTTQGIYGGQYPAIMLKTPTFSRSADGDFLASDGSANGIDTTVLAGNTINNTTFKLIATVAAGLTVGQGSELGFDATATGFIQFEADPTA